jgi:hypothetical protein
MIVHHNASQYNIYIAVYQYKCRLGTNIEVHSRNIKVVYS